MKAIMSLCAAFLLFLVPASPCSAQIRSVFPFGESFDTARVPLLPEQWSASKAKNTAGDFQTSPSTPYSAPACVLSTDARISQWLSLPACSFAGRHGVRLEFFERRSSSFNCGLVIEASFLPDDTTSASWMRLSDTLTLISSSAYVRRQLALPPVLDDRPFVRLRFRTLGNGTGATGTLRIDDIRITVTPACDMAIDSAVAIPGHITAGTDVPCTFIVRSRVSAGARTFHLALIDSTRGTSVADASFTHTFGASGEPLAVVMTYLSVPSGTHRMHCRLSSSEDEDTTNNTTAFTIAAASLPHTLVVNEIMYDPSAGQPEYIELYNQTDEPCPLDGWTLSDAPASKKGRSVIVLASASTPVMPHAYALVASDSSIIDAIGRTASSIAPALCVASALSLNNTGEDLFLLDASGAVIDSLHYAPSWHTIKGTGQGRSLEKIHPSLSPNDARSWGTSVAHGGGTPGAQNSVFLHSIPPHASLALSPNPFSPDGDGTDDVLGIGYALPSRAATIRLRIYDAAGRLVRTLSNNEPSAACGTAVWNGRDDAGARVRLGMYIIFFEALDTDGAVLRTLKDVAVVGARLR